MANYLDQTGLQYVLKSLDQDWMGSNGVLGYSSSGTNYAVQRDGTSKKLYVGIPAISELQTALNNLTTTVSGRHTFGKVKITNGESNTDIVADTNVDTLNLVAGDNITLTPDTTNDKITISSKGSFSITANASDDDIVVLTGTSGSNAVTYSASHAKKGPANGYTSGNTTTSISGSAGTGTIKIPQITVDAYGHITTAADESVTITMPTIPTTLPNASALSFYANDNTSASLSYTGSAAKSVAIKGGTNTKVTPSVANNKLTYTIDTDLSSYATKTYVDDAVTGLFEYKGTIGTGGTVTTLPASHEVGDVYYVKTAGNYAGVSCEVGDMIVCNTKGTASNNDHWDVVQGNWTATSGTDALSWNTSVTLATIGGVNIKAKLPSNPNTDTKVTSVENHYTPAGSAATLTASGTTLSFGGAVITGVNMDSKGHVTSITTSKLPSNPNTNSAHSHTAGAGLSVSGSGGTSGTTTYTLKTAATGEIGGVKAADVRTSAITTAQGGTTSGRYYGVEIDSTGKAFVNVPWVNTDTGTVDAALTKSQCDTAFTNALNVTSSQSWPVS